MPQISTQRLHLAEFTENDLAFLLELVNTPKWLQYIGNRLVATESEALKYLNDSLISGYRKNHFGLWKISLKNGMSIGMCGLVKRDSLEIADLGFALLPAFEKQGFAIEAAKATLLFAKNSLKMQKVAAITLVNNIDSRNLLVKLGFKLNNRKKVTLENQELLYYTLKL